MGFSINNNLLSLSNQKQLNKTTGLLGKTFEKLSSGKRINTASDDPAGLAIAESLRSNASTYTVAIRNANDAVSVMAIADTTLETASTITTRMSELASQAANGTLSDSQRMSIDQEYQSLKAELDRVQSNAQFNGESVTGPKSIQTGIDGSAQSQTIINAAEVSSSSLGLASTSLTTQAGARAALDAAKSATNTVANSRAELGAQQSRIDTVVSNTFAMRENTTAAESQIRDADIAEEAMKLTALKIRQQAGASLGAMSNLQSEIALKLLG